MPLPRPAILAPLLLSAALLSCSSEPDRDTAPHPVPAPAAASDPADDGASAPPVFEGPGSLLAQGFDGLSPAAAPRYFGPDNLFDLINGGAEIYVDFGLVRMVTADFRVAGRAGLTLTVEVYDMGSPRGAFGRVARFLAGRLDPSGAGAGLDAALADRAIFGDGDLVFWKDRYLVHLTLLDESPTATPEGIAATGAELLPRVAAALAARIASDPPAPPDLDRFPTEHRVARSEAWQPRALAGIDGLGAGYSVRYADGPAQWLAFATDQHTDEAAAEAAWSTVKGTEAAGRALAVKVAGRRVVGVIQDSDERLPEPALARFAEQLVEGFTR